MSKEKDKVHHINCFLIKEEYESFSDILRGDAECDSFDLKSDLKTEAKIFIGKQSEKEPKWVEFLNTAAKRAITELKNTSNRAVVLVKEKNRIFAISFGYGRYLIKDEAIVYDFGFRVAINAVDPDKLKSIDIANLEELTVHSRVQTSTDSSKESFGLDILNDLMRSVTGTPLNSKLAKVITGKDSAIFSANMRFDDIRKKCRLLLIEYNSKKYKEHFDWIDNLSEERDKGVISKLQELLVEDLKNKNTEKMHIAPSETVDWEDIDGFNYVQYDGDEDFFVTLDVDDYITKIRNLDELNYDKLKDHKLFIHYAQSDKKVPKWKITKCLTYETELVDEKSGKTEKFVYTLSHWYKIENNFVQEITDYVKGLPESPIDFLDCEVRTEGEYNEILAESSDDFFLLDKVNVKCFSARTVIEPCDILTKNMQFIHIKQKHNSANLSHLFSQGRVSSESLIKDPEYVKNIIAKAKEKRDLDLDFLPGNGKIQARDCEIVFGIIDPSEKEMYESLPFFSLLNLRQSSEMLRLLGFKVFLNKIKKNYTSPDKN